MEVEELGDAKSIRVYWDIPMIIHDQIKDVKFLLKMDSLESAAVWMLLKFGQMRYDIAENNIEERLTRIEQLLHRVVLDGEKDEYHVSELLDANLPALQKLARRLGIRKLKKKSIIQDMMESEECVVIVPEGFVL